MTTAAPRRPLRRALALIGATCALTLAGTMTAHAQTWSHTDPGRDVVSFDQDFEEMAAAPAQKRGDIRRFRVAHQASRVVVTFSMRESLPANSLLYYEIRTPKSDFTLTRFKWAGSRAETELQQQGLRKPTSCSGIDWDLDVRRSTVAVSIPRSCIGRPRWVRIGTAVVTYARDGKVYVDEGLQEGASNRLPLSPRVLQG